MSKYLIATFFAVIVISCGKTRTPPLVATWFANSQSINFLNLERMALDFRGDSTYRYYYRNAPIPPQEVGEDYTEGGRFRVRGDSLIFLAQVVNGERKSFEYARKFRVLPDTTDWPLRVTFVRRETTFEVYFQAQE